MYIILAKKGNHVSSSITTVPLQILIMFKNTTDGICPLNVGHIDLHTGCFQNENMTSLMWIVGTQRLDLFGLASMHHYEVVPGTGSWIILDVNLTISLQIGLCCSYVSMNGEILY